MSCEEEKEVHSTVTGRAVTLRGGRAEKGNLASRAGRLTKTCFKQWWLRGNEEELEHTGTLMGRGYQAYSSGWDVTWKC